MAIGFNDLDDTVPADTAFIGEGAAKIREVKQALNTVFPNVKAEITKPDGFGTSGTQPSAADYSLLFTEVDALVNPETSNSPVIPQGFVAMWNGDTADTAAVNALNNKGWFLCVGGSAPNGFTIPNLQNKFVKGWGDQPVTAGGGGGDARTGIAVATGTTTEKAITKSVVLDQANIPEHNHYAVSSDPDKYGADNAFAISTSLPYIKKTADSRGGIDGNYEIQGTAIAPTNLGETSKWGNSSPTGIDVGLTKEDFAHEHLISGYEPGYYVIAYIIYAGVV